MALDNERLKDLIREKIGRHRFIVVSNREPYLHLYSEDGVKCITPASGMVMAIEPIMKASGGVWIAHGAGDADEEFVDSHDRIQVPPQEPSYTLRRVWLTKEEEDAYYYGFSNEGLWPLSHIAYTRPIFRERDWDAYKKVNRKFADTVIDEMGGEKGFVFIQDYHFALLPRMIKEARPDITVAQFWHIPWPNQEIFRVCPWGEEILDGLLGNDLLGFHIRYHCQNFLDTVDRFIESRIDWERFSITRGGKETIVRPFPISTDFEKMEEIAKRPEISQNIINIRKRLGLKDRIIGLGVDRIDYIKGIPERFMAIDRFLERYPEYHRRFVFIQLGPLSRIRIQRYREYNDEIYNLMVEINGKYKKGDWQPIIVHKSHLSLEEIVSYYCLADLCIVSSLHDGMNLVTKEFVASRYDLEATLILSKFTGASRELEDALLINPYATDQFADTIKRALELSVDEKKRRMKAMRELVRERNVYNWACELINEVRRIG